MKFGIQIKGLGRALKNKSPSVIRPKPTGKGGKPLKPGARIKKADGGMLKAVKPNQKGLSKLPKAVRNKMGYMKKGGKVKKFPDLTGDGKVTRADVLKGRGVFASGGRPGLYANIHAKRKRGGRMRKKGAKGAPTAANFARAAQTARK
jgi:hypothetical protein